MKVLAIGHSWVVSNYRELLRELARHDLDLTAVVPDYWSEGGQKVVAAIDPRDNFDLRIIKPITHRQHLHIYPQLLRIILTKQPDVVFLLEEPNSVITAITSFFTKRIMPSSRVGFYTFLNDNRDFTKLPNVRSFLFPRWLSTSFKYCDYAVCASIESENQMMTRGFKKLTRIIPFGCNLKSHEPQSLSLKGRDEKKGNVPLIGFVGRLTQSKGVDLLLHALPELRRTREINVLIVGEGDASDSLKRLTSDLELNSVVQFTGAVTQSKVAEYLRIMDILVVPSRRHGNWVEQFGRVIVEGMAAGCLIIGSDSGEIPNVIGDNGFVFEENNYQDLIEKLKQALDLTEEEIRIRRRKAIDTVQETYDFSAVAKMYRDLFMTLIRS